ncbi:MAG: cytochrome C oxidase Cbb3 [Cytophagales bacterium]|nr:cytochrome C oxidase Cbb3 [Cytophagales bacterium]
MFKHYFEQVEGIATMPLISLVIFFTFFVGLTVWVIRANKHYLGEMEALPLEDNTIKDSAHRQ